MRYRRNFWKVDLIISVLNKKSKLYKNRFREGNMLILNPFVPHRPKTRIKHELYGPIRERDRLCVYAKCK